jgi:glycosyltransferase involved in cell wall biosynthesis
MKVLIDCHLPFSVTHGGMQTQIEETKARLERIGVEVDYLHWWESGQQPDIIHFFGAPAGDYVAQAHTKGIRFLLNNLFTATCNRSDFTLSLQAAATTAVQRLPLFRTFLAQPAWKGYREADHHVVSLEAEKRVLQQVYCVPAEKITCIPYGLSETFLKAGSGDRSEPHLICTGTITERKRSVELARLARRAQVPILFVGKPYSEAEPYWQKFSKLVDAKFVKHIGHTDSQQQMVELLQRSRGFVLMTQYENWCLSAHEAAACGLPLLLPDQKWSRERFGNQAHYFSGQFDQDARRLREFYENCRRLPSPIVSQCSWTEVAEQLKAVYERMLNTSL